MSLDDDFIDRNSEHFEKRSDLSAQPNNNKIVIKPPNKGKPWRRFWARTLDTSLHSFPVAIGLEMISPGFLTLTLSKYGQFVLTMKLLPFILLIEATLLSIFGTTLGKYLLNIKLTDIKGNKISCPTAFFRTFMVWIKGLAFGFPLVSMITAAYAAGKIRKDGTASWDDSNFIDVKYQELSGIKTLIAVFMIFGLIVLGVLGK